MSKLVRDRIPEIIRRDGIEPKIRTLENSEYKDELFKKIFEEIEEFKNAKKMKEKIEEMADILEVLNAICRINGIFINDVIAIGKNKRNLKGGFDKKIFLEIDNSE